MLTQAQHKALSKKLASLDTYDYAMTSAERRCVMTLMLIASGGEALTGQYFADQLGVSKSSIDKDMALLKTDLLGSGVRLESRVGKGSTLEGEEQALRHCGDAAAGAARGFCRPLQRRRGRQRYGGKLGMQAVLRRRAVRFI